MLKLPQAEPLGLAFDTLNETSYSASGGTAGNDVSLMVDAFMSWDTARVWGLIEAEIAARRTPGIGVRIPAVVLTGIRPLRRAESIRAPFASWALRRLADPR